MNNTAINNILRRPLLAASAALLVVGAIFMWIQNTFYGYLDNNNVIQDSLFLPLGAISVILGLMGLCFILIKATVRTLRSQS